MEKTCRLVHITYRENNRGPGREEYNVAKLPLKYYNYGSEGALGLGIIKGWGQEVGGLVVSIPVATTHRPTLEAIEAMIRATG